MRAVAGRVWWRVGLGVGLAAGGAAVAWRLGGTREAWLGVVVGGVTGSFAPSLTAWLAGRREAREALAGLGELAGGGPAGLLDPRRGVVGFLGREDELAGCWPGAVTGSRAECGW